MSSPTVYLRGDVLLADLPFADITGSKVRPVVVIQNNVANKVSGNLIVVAISTKVPQRPLPTQCKIKADSLAGRRAGLVKDSVADCSVIYTLAKDRIRRKLGVFPLEVLVKIDECLKISLALT